MHLSYEKLVVLAAAASVQAAPLDSSYDFNPLEHLSGVTPYFEPADPPRDPAPPQGCSVNRASYLSRHGAIEMNDFDYETYIEPFVEKLGNNSMDWSSIPELAFLSDWTSPNFTVAQLAREGKLEATQLGVTVANRYPSFRLPERVWASGAERVIKTAEGFIRGFDAEDGNVNLVEVYEGEEEGANTLTPYESCDAFSSSTGSEQETEYIEKYTTPIIERFNAEASSFNFTADDIFAMQSICGYETVVRGSSPFCSLDLFSPDEWLAYEYANDIFYHYNVGYGNPISGVIGFPWLNASLNLLTADEADQDLYISFAHRQMPSTALVAMGLFNNSQFSGANNINSTMPTDQINWNRAWVTSKIIPFLTNIGIERMSCNSSGGSEEATYYRVVVNGSPQSLPGCTDGPLESCSETGLQNYLEDRAALFGDFSQECDVSYQNSTDVLSIYTSSDSGTAIDG